MRVIETSHPVMALDYTPCGRFLVYVESQRHYRRVQEGRSESFTTGRRRMFTGTTWQAEAITGKRVCSANSAFRWPWPAIGSHSLSDSPSRRPV